MTDLHYDAVALHFEEQISQLEDRVGEQANELKAAQATIRSLTAVVEQAEKHVEDRDQKVGELAADLVETRSQFADAQKQIEALRRELDATLAWSAELFNERNEQRSLVADFNTRTVELSDEVARLNATIVRLACHRVGLHNCGGEWKNHDHAGDEPFPPMGSGLNSGGED